ncbi:hypothetical protein Dimus_037236 [Dionaea muscipula]
MSGYVGEFGCFNFFVSIPLLAGPVSFSPLICPSPLREKRMNVWKLDGSVSQRRMRDEKVKWMGEMGLINLSFLLPPKSHKRSVERKIGRENEREEEGVK